MPESNDWIIKLALSNYYTALQEGMNREQARQRLLAQNVPAVVVDEVVELGAHQLEEVAGQEIPGLRARETWWYRGPQESDEFWPALVRHLRDVRNWHPDDIKSLDETSNRIVASLEAPGKQAFQTKGLVVGYVQSGKTASYTAVITKAADVGYKHFVVIAGTTEKLRKQTQKRLSEELATLTPHRWFALTTDITDMALLGTNATSMLGGTGNQRTIAVVKKNDKVLKKLQHWMADAGQPVLARCPILLIDDEADDASINTAQQPERQSVINRRITELSAFPRTAYVAYTATPFANLLIDPRSQNLYPKDFIIPLPKPPSYFGAERLFGREFLDEVEEDQPLSGLDMIRSIPTIELSRVKVPSQAEKETFTPEIVPSLRAALRWFIMSQAALIVRGDNSKHTTLLVHTSQYRAAHRQMKTSLDREVDTLKRQVTSSDRGVMTELAAQWNNELLAVPSSQFGEPALDWDDIAPHIHTALGRVKVVLENAVTSELNYESSEPAAYVVTGGNILSRGLTLSGLTTAYFVRSAGSYDTLLQMGRWFGYHRGYVDLLRVWMDDDLRDKFRDLALVEEEIRNDMARYSGTITPLQFAVKIRTHPALNVTSRLKMQHAVVVQTSYYGKRPQTILFHHKEEDWLKRNIEATVRLLDVVEAAHGPAQREPRGLLYRDASHHVVSQFFQDYQLHERNRTFTTELVRDFVTKAGNANELERWDIAVVQPTSDNTPIAEFGNHTLRLLSRSRLTRRSSADTADIGALISQGDIAIGLPAEVRNGSARDILSYRDRLQDKKGLMLLYPIDQKSAPAPYHLDSREALDALEPVIGVALIFPDVESPLIVEKVQANIEETIEVELDELDAEDIAPGEA